MSDRRVFLLILIFGALTLAGFLAPGLQAREAVVGMDERIFKIVNEAQERMDADDLEGALRVLDKAHERRMSSYETAQVLRMTGLAYYHGERYDEAIEAYEEALAQERLPDSMIASLLGSLARLCLMQDRNDYAEEKLRQLLTLPKQDTADNRVLLASALIRQEKFEAALVPLNSAIGESRADGEQPSENWLSMLAAAYYSLEEHAAMREVVRELAEVYPSEQYLMNLAALHGQLGDRQKQLALVEAMLDDDRITRAAYLKMLASLYLAENLPFKAANLLETAVAEGRVEEDVATLEQTSQAWYLAQELERAVEPLARAAAIAARETESGELYLRLAGLHMDSYQWSEADQAAALALEAGGLKQEGEAWLMRGMANAQLERYDDAKVLFERAQAFESTRAHADQWLVYVASERKTKAVATGR
jgi:tetratricopeptide (TPR) repeat protein